MAWSNKQKQIFARACSAAGMSAEQRHLVVGQCDQRAVHGGKLTSTSPKLTNDDFEHCMAVVELQCGGQIPFNNYPPGHWQRKADEGGLDRRRWRIKQIALQLAAYDSDWGEPDARLLQWMNNSNILPAGTTVTSLMQLDYRQLRQVLDGLTAYAKRHGIAVGRAA